MVTDVPDLTEETPSHPRGKRFAALGTHCGVVDALSPMQPRMAARGASLWAGDCVEAWNLYVIICIYIYIRILYVLIRSCF